jgi:hypothetical protein
MARNEGKKGQKIEKNLHSDFIAASSGSSFGPLNCSPRQGVKEIQG